MGRLVQIGQEEQGVVPVFRTTVTAPMPIEVPSWLLILLAVFALAVILDR